MDTMFSIHGHRGFQLSGVIARLMAMGMHKTHAHGIARQLQRWIVCNGVIWTIDRLKAIKLAYIQKKANTIEEIPWLSRHRDGIPKGIFSVYRRYRWSKVVRFLNLHNLFVLEKVTAAQARKFLEAVNRSPVDPKVLAEVATYVRDGFIPNREADKLSKERTVPIANANPSTYISFKEVCIEGKSPVPRRIARERFDDPSNDSLRSQMCEDALEFLRVSFNRSLLGTVLRDLYAPLRPGLTHRSGMVPDPLARPLAGAIGITQEPGGKLRCYAAPFLPFQLALKPFKDSLEKRLRDLPTDCTYSHERGARIVQGWLTEEGTFVTAFDLSNATDNFPLGLQSAWLRQTDICLIQLEIFEKVSRLPWAPMKSAIEMGFPDSLVKWSVGQPLGLYGSFPAFALTHNYLLRGIEKSIFGEVRNEFVILGDDIVIKDELVALKYAAIMEALGVPISRAKSIVSDRLSEFGGFIITEMGMNKGTKLSKASRNSVIELGRTYGPSARRMVRKVVRNDPLVDALEAIPACVGGLGWGISTLDEALRPRVNAQLFGMLTGVKGLENTLPSRLKTSVQQSVYTRLGFSFKDFVPERVSKTPTREFLREVPIALGSQLLPISEAHVYVYTGELLKSQERSAYSYAAMGDYESHATIIKRMRGLTLIRKMIELRYQKTTPDSHSFKINNRKKDGILGEKLLTGFADTIVDHLEHYFALCTKISYPHWNNYEELLRLMRGLPNQEYVTQAEINTFRDEMNRDFQSALAGVREMVEIIESKPSFE